LWGSREILNFLFCEKTYPSAHHFEFRKKDLPTGVILREKINNSKTLRKSLKNTIANIVKMKFPHFKYASQATLFLAKTNFYEKITYSPPLFGFHF
jgi:hypothetical protein